MFCPVRNVPVTPRCVRSRSPWLGRRTLATLAAGILVACTLACAGPVRAADGSRNDRPNVVLIMADDMGYECVSANGGQSYRTPHLDKLASEGMRFEHCHSQPICTPSRVQIMTGIYNNRNYVRFGVLDPAARTFGNLFQEAGYRTCIAGKWQLDGGMDAPHRFGFDEYCLWQLVRRPGRYSNPGLEINGKRVDYRKGEFGPDIVSDYLCDFIQRHRDQPFFVWYPMILPHFPFVPTPDSPDYDPTVIGEKGLGDPKYFKGMVEYADKIVGKIVATVDRAGLSENTIIIFTGDNGTHPHITSILNGKPYPGGKGSTTDNGTHVPLIARWKTKIPANTVSQHLVDFTDMLPTVADAAGSVSRLKNQNIDGRSFLPGLLSATAPPHRDYIYCWYHRDGVREKAKQLARTHHFKLYADGRFFNTAADPMEKRPLDSDSLEGKARAAYQLLQQRLQPHLQVTRQADPVQNALREKLKRSPVKNQSTKSTGGKSKQSRPKKSQKQR